MNNTVKTPFEIVQQQFKELLTQNDIHYSIIAMNKYIQSPKYFQVVYNVKRKLKFIMKSIRDVFRKELTGDVNYYKEKILQLPKATHNEVRTSSSSSSIDGMLNTRNIMLAFACVGTCVWMYNKRKETRDLKRRVKNIEREKQILIFENKELLKKIRTKH